MIKKVKDFNLDLIKIFPTLNEDTLYVRKVIGGVITKDDSQITDEGLHISSGYITTLDIDRDKDVIMPDGINWKEYNDNNVVLHMHDHWELPVGKCNKLEQDKVGWIGTTEYFVNDKKDSQGWKNWEYRNAKFPLGRSIGFAPTEYAINDKYGEEFEKGWKDAYKEWVKQYKIAYGKKPEGTPDIIYTKSIAYEYSDVTVPANPTCVGEEGKSGIDLIAISKGLNVDGKINVKSLIEIIKKKDINNMDNKGVIGYKKTPLADIDESWSASQEVKKAKGNASALKTIHTWVDISDEDYDSTESKWYKLPHHKGDGNHSCVWRGVSAAMGALLGARGGVNVPGNDRKGIYNHLKKHYAEFDKEVPEFKEYTDIISEEEMEIKEILEKQQKLIDDLTAEIKTLQDNAKKVIEETELQKQEDQKKELENDETIVNEFETLLKDRVQNIVDSTLSDLKEKIQKFQDNIAQLTGTI